MSERLTLPVCLADYERLAHQRLDPNALSFFAGGAADEITVRWNREAFDKLALSPRVLRGGSGGHTRVSLFGRDYKHPIFIAPMALPEARARGRRDRHRHRRRGAGRMHGA